MCHPCSFLNNLHSGARKDRCYVSLHVCIFCYHISSYAKSVNGYAYNDGESLSRTQIRTRSVFFIKQCVVMRGWTGETKKESVAFRSKQCCSL